MPMEGISGFSYPVGSDFGTRIRLEVRFDPEDLKKLKNSANQFLKLDKFEQFWHNYGIWMIIRDDIKSNIINKRFPGNIGAGPWDELSEDYSEKVGGRTQMRLREFGSTTGIWNAYIKDPRITEGKHLLRYQPKRANLIKHKGVDIGLRFGIDKVNLPAREWFGMNKEARNKIYTMMNKHMKSSLAHLAKHGTLEGMRV